MSLSVYLFGCFFFFFFQAEDGIRDHCVTGVQTCALPIWSMPRACVTVTRWFVTSRGSRLLSWTVPASTFPGRPDRKSTRLNSSHTVSSYAVFCLKKKKKQTDALQNKNAAHHYSTHNPPER